VGFNKQEAVSQHCSSCRTAESRVSEAELELNTLQQTLQTERATCDHHRKYIDELESNLSTVADDVTKQVFQMGSGGTLRWSSW